MKFGIRNTSFVYLNSTGNIWEDNKAHIQRAEKDGFDSFWVMDHFYHHSPDTAISFILVVSISLPRLIT